jgi:hypothetical protein
VLKNEYAERAAIKDTDDGVAITITSDKKGTSASWDVYIELSEGILALQVTDTSTKVPSQRSQSWPGKGDNLSLKEQVKAWVE